MKVLDKVLKHESTLWFALEFFPPMTPEALTVLYERMDRMSLLGPLFIAVTSPSIASTPGMMEICSNSQNVLSLDTVMHLNSKQMSKEPLARILKEAKDNGITNILAKDDVTLLRDKQCLQETAQMVRNIRAIYGTSFCIGTVAYPEGSRDAVTAEEDLDDLKSIVDAGVDFIVTSHFFDLTRYDQWLAGLRRIGIHCPVIPGITPINSWEHFLHMTKLNPHVDKTGEWAQVNSDLRQIKHDEEAVKKYGMSLCINTIERLLVKGWNGIYLYTLNLENAVTQIITTVKERRLGLLAGHSLPPSRPLSAHCAVPPRHKPEQCSAAPRPLWHRACLRDINWDDFPNGRWGDSASPAFLHVVAAPYQCKQLWHNVSDLDGVITTFCDFLEGTIEALPWFEGPLAEESRVIVEHLLHLSRNGFLTISSQPKVDAASSTDAVHGWGPPGGFVFQKEYLELFCSCAKAQLLLEVLEKSNETVPEKVTFILSNFSGSHCYQNFDSPNALTWGVFPGREVSQPTTVDPTLFGAWKEEAFALWTRHFSETEEVPAIIKEIQHNWFLVSIANNDFKGDFSLWTIFDAVIAHPDFDVYLPGSLAQLPKSLGSARPEELFLGAVPYRTVDDASSLHTTNSLWTLSSTGKKLETVASQTSIGLTPPSLEHCIEVPSFLSS
eukprot:GGOE01018358.1.p1 GENE.GGOE01018358.1~~GGOE01018358.1.p1  ORF type:complete len:667 (-),score=126.29 GGOE01018358.1:224-2224(-)